MYYGKVIFYDMVERVEKMNLFWYCLGNKEWGEIFFSKNFNIVEIKFSNEL